MAKSSSEDRVQAESVLVEQRRNLISNNGVSSVSMQPGPKRKRMGLGKFSTPRQAKKLQSDLNTHHTVEQLTGCEATNGITCVHMLKSGQTVCLANDGSLAEPLVDNPQLDVDTPEKSAESECKIEPPALEYKPARKLMVLESTANQSVDHKICDDGNRALPANESATISLKLESNSNQYSCQAEITAQDKNARSRDELLAMFSVENED